VWGYIGAPLRGEYLDVHLKLPGYRFRLTRMRKLSGLAKRKLKSYLTSQRRGEAQAPPQPEEPYKVTEVLHYE